MTTLIDNKPPRKKVAEGVEQSRAKATSPSTPQSLYAKRVKLYPKLARGFFRNLKWFALVILLGIYYITPWIRWNRGPDQPSQAVLIDFENARFYFFFIEIWPQEVHILLTKSKLHTMQSSLPLVQKNQETFLLKGGN